MFGRYVNLGSASASIIIDVSQAQNAVAAMRSISQQIAQSVTQANQQIASVNQAAAQAVQQAQQQAAAQQNQQAAAQQQASAQQVAAQQQNLRTVQQEFRTAQTMLSQVRAQISVEQQRYNQAAAQAPSGLDRSATVQQFAVARQSVSQLSKDLADLRVRYQQATSPQQQNALSGELLNIQTRTQQASQGMSQLTRTVSNFSQTVTASRSGIDGYFNSVRENLERINETSLAANLQEISFRLLPLGIAASALTKQGVETAQQIQEATISFSAFTGSEEKARELMGQLTDQAHKFGQPMIETLNIMQRFAPLIRNAGLQLDDVYNIAVRLATLNPAQGIEGALYAINEALAGQWRSLQFRFNLPTSDLRDLIQSLGFTEGFDKFLNGLNRSTEFAEKFGQTSRAAFTRLQDSINNFLATSMNHLLDGMSDAADTAANFFNSLAEGNSIITNLTGAFLSLTSTLTTALITLGQVALAVAAIRAVFLTPQTREFATNIAADLTNAILKFLPAGVVSAFEMAVGGIAAAIKTALSLAVTALPAIIAGVLGTLAGTFIAGTLHIGGAENPEDAMKKLIEILAVASGGILRAFLTIAQVIINAGNLVGAAIHNIGLILGAAGDSVGQVFSHIGAVLTDTLGNIQIAVGNVLRGIAEWIAEHFPQVESGGLGLAGVNLVASGTQAKLSVADELQTPLTDFFANITDQLIDLSKLPLLPDADQQREIQRQMGEWVVRFVNTFTGSNIPIPEGGGGTGVPETGAGGGLLPGVFAFDSDEVKTAIETIKQMATMERDFALQQKRTMEDRALAAQREAEDAALARSRAESDFALQQGRSLEDFNRQRAQSIEDFNRQTLEAQQQTNDRRLKMQEDFDIQMMRAQQDHLRDMQRMARDIDTAIAGRDFLSAQNTIQRMRDAEEDFNVEQQRRREDFARQLGDLQENLDAQQKSRDEDFQRQLQRQQENFELQRRRQADDFNRQQQLAEQDRQRRLARQAYDYFIQDYRAKEDFARRITDMINHNELLRQYWNQGLSQLRSSLQEFFADPLVRAPAATSNPFQTIIGTIGGVIQSIGGILTGNVSGYSDLGTGTPFENRGTAFAEGSWFVPRTMRALVHQGEIIVPAAESNAVRSGDASIGYGKTYVDVSIPLQVINAQNMDERRLAGHVRDLIIPHLTRAIEEKTRQVQTNRGRF